MRSFPSLRRLRAFMLQLPGAETVAYTNSGCELFLGWNNVWILVRAYGQLYAMTIDDDPEFAADMFFQRLVNMYSVASHRPHQHWRMLPGARVHEVSTHLEPGIRVLFWPRMVYD